MTSNKLQTWQDHDVRNLITSSADHKHMFCVKQRKTEIFDKIATDFNSSHRRAVYAEMGQASLKRSKTITAKQE